MNKRNKKSPGKSFRDGLSIFELTAMFPDEGSAREWFEMMVWAAGRPCPHCGSQNNYHVRSEKPQPYRCRSCRSYFSVRTGTVMTESKLPFRTWLYAIYMLATNIKGVSAMRLHREFKVKYETAWHLGHRLREAWNSLPPTMTGEVEIDETFMGGKEKNKHEFKKLKAGRGTVGEAVVVGMLERDSKRVRAVPVKGTDARSLLPHVETTVQPGSTIYTDELKTYRLMDGRYSHKAVKHGVREFVVGQAHTNGIESFWALLKRGYYGTYHRMSGKHLHRYVNEFAGRHNIRSLDTLDQMALITRSLVGKRLSYERLVA